VAGGAVVRPLTVTAVQRRFVLLSALRWLPLGVVSPLLVLLLQARGVGLATIGQLLALHGLVVLGLELPTGGLADAIGRRRTLLVGAVFTTATYAAWAVARTPAQFAAVMVLSAVGRALDSGSLEACWYVDTARAADPAVRLRSGLARAGVAKSLALALGAIAGGLLPNLAPGLPTGGTALVTSYTIPVAVAAALSLGHLVAAALLVQEQRPSRGGHALRGLAELRAVAGGAAGLARRDRAVRLLLLAAVGVGAAIYAVEALWQPRFAALLGGAAGHTEVFGLLAAASFGAAAIGSALASPLARALARGGHLGGRRGCVAALLLAGVVLAGLAMASTMVLAAALYVGLYATLAANVPLRGELLHEAVPDRQRATMVSAQSLALQLGGVGSGLSLPRLAAQAGVPAAWLVGAVLFGIAALITGAVPVRRGRSPEPSRQHRLGRT
jgi:MFS family permease